MNVGAYAGVGQRPEDVELASLMVLTPDGPAPAPDLLSRLGVRSEFGMYPVAVFTQMKAYF